MPVIGERVVKTNRHPNTDGSPHGWVDEFVPTLPGSWWRWTTRLICSWSGERERARVSAEVSAHNAALPTQRRAAPDTGGGDRPQATATQQEPE